MLEALLESVSAAPWAYAAIAVIVALDAFLPVVPGETAVITGGVLAAQHELSLPLVVVAAFAGALAGDHVSFGIGRVLGQRACRRLFGGAKGQRRLSWAAGWIAERGRIVLLAARFVPGGRTAVTFAWGALPLGWRSFVVADAIAAAAWSIYAAGLGHLGGQAFADSFWPALLAALAATALLTAALGIFGRRSPSPPAATVDAQPHLSRVGGDIKKVACAAAPLGSGCDGRPGARRAPADWGSRTSVSGSALAAPSSSSTRS